MIESGQEAINNAIDEAKSAAEIDLREKMRSAQMANIMNYSFQGILSTDQDGIITFANKYCYSILDSGHALLTGRSILIFSQISRWRRLPETEKASFRAAHLCLLPPDGKLRSGTG